jgi:hypothetical protein
MASDTPQIRGKAIEWGEAGVERMADLSLEDVVEAAVFWHEHAPRGMKGLLDAKVATIGNILNPDQTEDQWPYTSI